MEYCGAGSVSDIIRLRNKTVSFFEKCITLTKIKLWITTRSQNKSQSYEARSWLMLWFFRKQAHAVALISCLSIPLWSDQQQKQMHFEIWRSWKFLENYCSVQGKTMWLLPSTPSTSQSVNRPLLVHARSNWGACEVIGITQGMRRGRDGN